MPCPLRCCRKLFIILWKLLRLPVALATFCYGLHLIPGHGSLHIGTLWYLVCLACAFISPGHSQILLRLESCSNCPSFWPSFGLSVSKDNPGENKKTFIKQNVTSPTAPVSWVFIPTSWKENVDHLKTFQVTRRTVLSHCFLPSTPQEPDANHAAVWGRFTVRCFSSVSLSLLTITSPRWLHCVKAVIKSYSEHCGSDQHNAPVGLQGQSLSMRCPIKYSSTKGVSSLSSKLIVPLGQALHWDVRPWVLRRRYSAVRVPITATIVQRLEVVRNEGNTCFYHRLPEGGKTHIVLQHTPMALKMEVSVFSPSLLFRFLFPFFFF